MSDTISSILLGILQGLTEFIPVSSTGHLIAFEKFLHFQAPPEKIFEVVVQLGSAFAVFILYFKRLTKPLYGSISNDSDRKFITSLILATCPAALLGFLCHDFIKSTFFNTTSVACMLILGGLILFLLDRKKSAPFIMQAEQTPLKTALYVGLFQATALLPGVSRSGATIASSYYFGMGKKQAAEFSFFLSVPAIMGAGFYELFKTHHLLGQEHLLILGTGFLAAFLSSLLVLRPLIFSIERWGFTPFAIYRILLGIFLLVFAV
jgi:undecaprenyl-diphosphatase